MPRVIHCAILLVQSSLVLCSQHAFAQKHNSSAGQSEVQRGERLSKELREAQDEMNSAFQKAIRMFTPTEKEQAHNAKLPATERDHEADYDRRMLMDLNASQEA